ncbi:hypothetical protein [Treponema bryantii]|uniref:hypothetical protein n=1 Tax=Treponema bryantii TaxID=163 RepID=UPI0003B629CD|nr:hypothetical protein [Treponema bryantii]
MTILSKTKYEASMENATRKKLATIAEKAAEFPFHGYIEGKESNLEPIIQFFPKWTPREADGLWCAAFVYYCCRQAGFEIPIRPDECKTCHLAGCIAWEEFTQGENDHIGIVIENREDTILAAEGNINNKSEIIERQKDEHIRAYIRIPDGYKY